MRCNLFYVLRHKVVAHGLVGLMHISSKIIMSCLMFASY